MSAIKLRRCVFTIGRPRKGRRLRNFNGRVEPTIARILKEHKPKCTEMQENMWSRLRESRASGLESQPSPRIFLHIFNMDRLTQTII